MIFVRIVIGICILYAVVAVCGFLAWVVRALRGPI
jgi:hypothetical protein